VLVDRNGENVGQAEFLDLHAEFGVLSIDFVAGDPPGRHPIRDRTLEPLSRESVEQLQLGAGWALAGELRSALAADLLDDRDGVAIFVIAEQPLEQVGVRIGAHDSNCGPNRFGGWSGSPRLLRLLPARRVAVRLLSYPGCTRRSATSPARIRLLKVPSGMPRR
jgi:hypothetical protein